MSEKDNNKCGKLDDESWGGDSMIPDDMDPYENKDPNFNTGLWQAPDMGLDDWPEFPVGNPTESLPEEPAVDRSTSEISLPEGLADPEKMQVLFTERDARNVRFRNLIAKGRHMMVMGVDAAAEKYFRLAADEGYHEANFQIALLRINRVIKETETGYGPDSRDAVSESVPGRRVMRRDLAEHFALMTDSVFRYADDHMVFQAKEILEKAASLGLLNELAPEDADKGYKAILKIHDDSTWDIVNYDDAPVIQNLMVLLSECRKADRYDMPEMLGVLLFKLNEFLATNEFEEFAKRFRTGA